MLLTPSPSPLLRKDCGHQSDGSSSSSLLLSLKESDDPAKLLPLGPYTLDKSSKRGGLPFRRRVTLWQRIETAYRASGTRERTLFAKKVSQFTPEERLPVKVVELLTNQFKSPPL